MEFAGQDQTAGTTVLDACGPSGDESEERTRDRVCRTVLERGPVTAAELAGDLGLTSAAVRRHLDVLVAQGLATVRDSGTTTHRGRGRPARRFVLTDAGHAAMTSEYDGLATSALRFLKSVAGDDAVRQFADHRVSDFERRYSPVVTAAGTDPQQRVQALADALSVEGYSASTRPLQVGATSIGVQLCQGHCPVQHVAREFPELCEAETDAFSRMLGVHVQRLATLAHGEHVCTTHIPSMQSTTQIPSVQSTTQIPSVQSTTHIPNLHSPTSQSTKGQPE
jgi:predicted ArsR family transcriptional regulator